MGNPHSARVICKPAQGVGGGGSRGALRAGALEVLLERGLRPQIVVGTSAGALNAIFVAADPTPHGARAMQKVWRGGEPARAGGPRGVAPARRGMFGRAG